MSSWWKAYCSLDMLLLGGAIWIQLPSVLDSCLCCISRSLSQSCKWCSSLLGCLQIFNGMGTTEEARLWETREIKLLELLFYIFTNDKFSIIAEIQEIKEVCKINAISKVPISPSKSSLPLNFVVGHVWQYFFLLSLQLFLYCGVDSEREAQYIQL